ncbi:MAG: hypothetical protein JKX81_07850 [Arenicella sp.]|nr:hypothetical protein [Arenicella sp.]
MKQIYLHIGFGKTGTTSIQQFLAVHNENLLSLGIHYVLAGGGISGGGHQSLAKSCIDLIPDYMEIADPTTDIENVKVEIARTNSDVLLLSAENFQLANPAKVKSLLGNLCDEYVCKIILFVRSQDELLESEYNQMVKLKSVTDDLKDYADNSFNGNFLELASEWESTFGVGALICRVYNAREKNVIYDFLSCLPIEKAAVHDLFNLESIVSNESLSVSALSQQFLKNRSDKPALSLLDAEISKLNYPAVLMNSTEAKEFRALFQEQNLMFSSRYLGTPMRDLQGRRFSDLERDRYSNYWKEFERTLNEMV